MKTLKLITLGIMMFFASNSMNAQLSVNVNLGLQPSWGPVGYASVNYYYLPDIEAYYDVRTTQFIYLRRGVWIRSSYLPRQYRDYDLNSGYKVVINDYHGSRPYNNYRHDRVRYYKGYGSPQRSIGNGRGNRNYRNGNDNHRNDYRRNDNRRNDYRGNDNRGNGNRNHGNNGKGHNGRDND